MNTFLPVFEKFRSACVAKLMTYGVIRRKKRRREVQMEFRWR